MRITATLPDHGTVVECVLEGFTLAACAIIASGVVPPFPPPAIQYREEKGEAWLLPHQVLKAGWGDCEDLCIWTAAGLRVSGQDPGAGCTLRMTGPGRVHCLVQLSNGQTIDVALEARQRQGAMRRQQQMLGAAPKRMPTFTYRQHASDPNARPDNPGRGAPPAAAPGTYSPVREQTSSAAQYQPIIDEIIRQGRSEGTVVFTGNKAQPMYGRDFGWKGDSASYAKASKIDPLADLSSGMGVYKEMARAAAAGIEGGPVAGRAEFGRGLRQPPVIADPEAVDPLDPMGGYDPYGGYGGYDPSGGFEPGYGFGDGYPYGFGQNGFDPMAFEQYASEGSGFYDMPMSYDDLYGQEQGVPWVDQWVDDSNQWPIDNEGDALDSDAIDVEST